MSRGGKKTRRRRAGAPAGAAALPATAMAAPAANPPEAPPLAAVSGNPMRTLRRIAVAGAVVRLAVCLVSWGTNDTMSFVRFGHDIQRDGFFAAYRNDPLLNHPPLVAGWSLLALVLARGHSPTAAIVFRVPVVLADAAAALLLGKVALDRGLGARAAAAITAGYAFNLCGILISGYHCNTDPVYAMLSLLAVVLLREHRRPLLAGLALGLAMNVKLIPGLLVLPLALTLRSWRDAARFLGGLAVMGLPFLPPLLIEPAFARNVLAYRSQLDNWGVPYLLTLASGQPLPEVGPPAPGHPAGAYFRTGSWLILALVAAWGVLARRLARWDAHRIAGVTFALFLVFAPGFGVQYTVMVAPLLYLAASPRLANAYGLLAGAFLVAVYWFFYDGGFPLSSLFHRRFPWEASALGLTAWAALVYFLLSIAPRRQGAAPAAAARGGGGARRDER